MCTYPHSSFFGYSLYLLPRRRRREPAGSILHTPRPTESRQRVDRESREEQDQELDTDQATTTARAVCLVSCCAVAPALLLSPRFQLLAPCVWVGGWVDGWTDKWINGWLYEGTLGANWFACLCTVTNCVRSWKVTPVLNYYTWQW